MRDKTKILATRGYIIEAAKRYQTPVAAAFRRSLGIHTTNAKQRPRTRQNRQRGQKPTRKDIEHCRKQRHGVVWRDDK